MRLGIYGGTFDPVHVEHIKIAQNAIRELNLDKLIILPAGEPPHKDVTHITDKSLRYEMCKLAFTDEKMEVLPYEIDKKGKSYTYETLEHFAEGNNEIFFILGGDSLGDIYKWKNPDRIFELATICVIGREIHSRNEYLNQFKDRIIKLEYAPTEVSSTEVRIACEFGQPIDNLVPSVIKQFIEEHKLYIKYRDMTARVQPNVSPKRFVHIMNTTLCGVQMAHLANVSVQDAFVACALHDCAKGMTDFSAYKLKLKAENMFIPEPVIHAFVGSYVVKKDFGITDKNIRNAIKYHTTGRPNMSQLEKLVYVADCIERGRNYPGVDKLREIARKDFEHAFVLCLNSTFNVVVDKTMCPLTLDAIDFYGK